MINCCLRYQSLPLGEGGFSNLLSSKVNWKRRMREIIGCLNIYRYENRGKNIYPHQSKIKDFCQLPPGEAFVNNNLQFQIVGNGMGCQGGDFVSCSFFCATVGYFGIYTALHSALQADGIAGATEGDLPSRAAPKNAG